MPTALAPAHPTRLRHPQALEQVLLAPEDGEHFSIHLDAMLLAQADPLLADALVRAPKATLEKLESAAYTAQVGSLLLLQWPRPAHRAPGGRCDCCISRLQVESLHPNCCRYSRSTCANELIQPRPQARATAHEKRARLGPQS